MGFNASVNTSGKGRTNVNELMGGNIEIGTSQEINARGWRYFSSTEFPHHE